MTKETLSAVLDFVAKRKLKLNSAKLLIGKNKIELHNYTEEGILALLEQPIVAKHIASMSKE